MGPPVSTSPEQFKQGEKVYCFHSHMLYDAKILRVDVEKQRYFVHYNGWNSKWDEWVEPNHVHKYTPENEKIKAELAEKVKEATLSQLKKPSRKSTPAAKVSVSRTSVDRSGSVSRNTSRTSTPTPVLTPSSASNASGVESSRAENPASNILTTLPRASGTPKGARRSTRTSLVKESTRAEKGKTRSSSGLTRASRSQARAEAQASTSDKALAAPALPVIKRPFLGPKLKTIQEPPYPFDFNRIKDYVNLADFPEAAYPFSIPDDIRKLFLYDRWMVHEEQLIPLAPAKISIRQLLTDFIEHREREKKRGREDDSFVTGCIQAFGESIHFLVTHNETSVTEHEQDPCDVYGLIHFIRFVSFLPRLFIRTSAQGIRDALSHYPSLLSPSVLRDRMYFFLEFLTDCQDQYFASDMPLFTAPVDRGEE